MNNGNYTAFHNSELTDSFGVDIEDPESIWYTKPVGLGWKTLTICGAVSIVSGIYILHLYWN